MLGFSVSDIADHGSEHPLFIEFYHNYHEKV